MTPDDPTPVPRVSIIVPVYNYAHFLGEALSSVLAQTMDSWECVVVDDGSTDDTPRVVTEYAGRDPRIRYVHQDNRGLAAARNTGIRHSRGAYLQFLDADDRLRPEKIATQASYLDGHPDVDIVIGPAGFFRTEAPDVELHSMHGALSRPLAPRISEAGDVRRRLEHYNIMVVIAPLVRRAALDRAGTFNETLRACEDWDLWLRCAIAGCRFEYLDHPRSLALVRTHPESMSRSAERMVRALIDAARSFEERGDRLPLVYEMAAGAGDVVDRGQRFTGARRIFHAARNSEISLWRLRWLAYGLAAVVLPRRLFWWAVTRPMPERALELARRIGATRI
jgi:glycosyltransferase involved in cell wall biosynthesis